MSKLFSFFTIILITFLLFSSTQAEVEPSLPGLDKDAFAKLQDKAQKFEFQTEVSRMLNIIVHSLYKSTEIFLRELISNASDALDKLRFVSLTNSEVLKDDVELKIEIKANKDEKTLIIRDTGIGMSKQDLITNLGTIAKSGTNDFIQKLQNNTADMSLIGQFGVGFYSIYLVADTVTVVSKHPGQPQYIWESNAQSEFTVVEDPRGPTLVRGTEITLYIKDGSEEFLEEERLKALVQKYSQFINFPIYLWTEKSVSEEVPLEDEPVEDKPTDELDEKSDVEDVATEDKPKTKTIEKKVQDWEKVNTNKPIWTRSSKDVTDEEYHEFYKAFTKDTENPMAYDHFKAEGEHDFKSILFIPAKAPTNFLQQADAGLRNIKLYVRRVFITDELIDFLPRWLSFIKGLVDSEDFPLNVSRETVQESSIIKFIKKKVISKALDLFKSLSKDTEKYKKFMEQYGLALKLGAMEDKTHSSKLIKLLRFESSKEKFVGLEDYVKRMKQGQTQIYFLTGTSLEDVKKSPFLEKIEARGYEVLYGSEPIDEYLFQSIQNFDGVSLQNIAKTGVKFGDEDEEEKKELEDKFKPLMDWLKTVLADSVEKIEISDLLTKSPMAIVANQFGWTGNSERLMNSQAFKQAEQNYMYQFQKSQKKIVQLNHRHPIVMALLDKVEAGNVDESTTDIAKSLYDMALIRSGYDIYNSETFATRVEKIIRNGLGVDEDAQAQVDIKPAKDKVVSEQFEEEVDDEGDQVKMKQSVKIEEDEEITEKEAEEAIPYRDEL